ncbi:MAG: restriction endonuclease subunit S [Pseudomonadota bacterium]
MDGAEQNRLGWEFAKLDDVARLIRGVTYKKADASFEPSEGKIPLLRGNNIQKGNMITDELVYVPPERVSSDQMLLPQDVVLTMSSGSADLVGKAALNAEGFSGSFGAFCAALRTHKGVSERYLLYFLLSQAFKRQVLPSSKGTNINNLKKDHILSATIPLAPESEQRRIVTKIEELFSELDNGVESLKNARAQLQTYRQSLLKAAFEGRLTEQWRKRAVVSSVTKTLQETPAPPKPNRWKTRSGDVIYGHPCLAVGNPKTPLPDQWQWVPLVDIARMESGHTPSRRHPEWWNGDIPWIGIADARENQGNIIHSTKQHTNEDGLANSAARLLPEGTVCVSRTASVGYVVEMGAPMATSQDFVNWVPTGAVTSAWLRLVFGAHREYLMKFGKGTTHRTIYFPEWMSVHIGLPPIEEQQRIVEEVDAKLSELDAIGDTIDSGLSRSQLLRQSVLKCAFEGKLVPQDPNDEPASVLLERIRQDKTAGPARTNKKRHKREATAELFDDQH